MHRLTLLIAALGALASPAIAHQCASNADEATYEVQALRTQMMVLALKCGRQDEYNTRFIKRFQPAVQANERAMATYFRRVYGRSAQGRKDVFTTELANVMSDEANRQGVYFCGRASMIINEMNALHSIDELPAYAEAKDLSPAGFSMCPVAAAPRRRK
jgi:hypothetical protein